MDAFADPWWLNTISSSSSPLYDRLEWVAFRDDLLLPRTFEEEMADWIILLSNCEGGFTDTLLFHLPVELAESGESCDVLLLRPPVLCRVLSVLLLLRTGGLGDVDVTWGTLPLEMDMDTEVLDRMVDDVTGDLVTIEIETLLLTLLSAVSFDLERPFVFTLTRDDGDERTGVHGRGDVAVPSSTSDERYAWDVNILERNRTGSSEESFECDLETGETGELFRLFKSPSVTPIELDGSWISMIGSEFIVTRVKGAVDLVAGGEEESEWNSEWESMRSLDAMSRLFDAIDLLVPDEVTSASLASPWIDDEVELMNGEAIFRAFVFLNDSQRRDCWIESWGDVTWSSVVDTVDTRAVDAMTFSLLTREDEMMKNKEIARHQKWLVRWLVRWHFRLCVDPLDGCLYTGTLAVDGK